MPAEHGRGLELRHLRYLLAVVGAGSVTAAAQRLFTSQPSLSRQLRDLEERVGTPLLTRGARGVEATAAGRAFIDHARLALTQVDAAIEAARAAAVPARARLALGFLTGEEMTWLPEAMRLLGADLSALDVTVSSAVSPDLADAVVAGRLDAAFMRREPGRDLAWRLVAREPLVVLMPVAHRLARRRSVRPRDLVGEPFVAMGERARVLRRTIDAYLREAGVVVESTSEADDPAVLLSRIASTGAVALIPAYVEDLIPGSVTSRPLTGVSPTIDLVVGYRRDDRSPTLALFLSRLDALLAPTPPRMRDRSKA